MGGHAERGERADALTERSSGAGLLVVGCHHHGVPHRALFGSVSHASRYHAGCPVAVVPAARQHTDRHAATASSATG